MSPASDLPAEAFPPESSGAPENAQAKSDTLPDMLPARGVAKAAMPAFPATGAPQNLPVPVAPAGPLVPQWPASPTPGDRAGGYPYGPSASPGPGDAGSFGGGAYQGPTGGGYNQRAPGAGYVEPTYVEPRQEDPRQAQGNSGFQTPEYRGPDFPTYGGQGSQHWQGGYQGGGSGQAVPGQAVPGQAVPGQAVPGQLPPSPQTPPPPVPNAQGYPDQSAAGYPGPTGGYGFLASPTPMAAAASPSATGFPPQDSFPLPAGYPAPPAGSPFAPAGSPSAPAGSPSAPAGGFPSSPWPSGFQSPNVPGGQPPGFGEQQAEGFQQTATFPGPQPGIANQQAGAYPGFGQDPAAAAGQLALPSGIGQPPFPGAQFGQMPFAGPATPTALAAMPWYQRLGSGNPRLLIGGAVAVVVVVGGIALAVPKLLGSSDPGCASYNGTTLPAYNRTISDLNARASQSQLTSDMTSAIADLTTAADQAKSATVKSALDGLLSELSTVRTDVQKGSVSAQTVTALNNASRAADNAC